MNNLKKYVMALYSQVHKDNVKIPIKSTLSPKIHDMNLAITNGVINEKSDANLRSQNSNGAKRKRGRPSKQRED